MIPNIHPLRLLSNKKSNALTQCDQQKFPHFAVNISKFIFSYDNYCILIKIWSDAALYSYST